MTTDSAGDTLVGTALNDLFDASANNTLNAKDVLTDSSTSDADILNATVASATIDPRIQNVEKLNITGQYVTTGLKVTNVTGTKDLNLDTTLAGGTASVTDVNSIAVQNIKAGSNISTLNVTSLSSGTRDTVNVDAGSANVTLAGNAGGADKYAVTMAADKTLTVAADKMASAGDTLTVNLSGDLAFAQADTADNAQLATTFVNNAATASTVTITGATKDIAKSIALSGNEIVLKTADATLLAGTAAATAGVSVTSDATKSTIELTATTIGNAANFNKAVVDEIKLSGAGATDITVNEATKLVLAKDQKGTGLTANIENAAGTMASAPATTGTLLLDVNASQTATVATGTNVDTVLITAGALAADANGNSQTVSLATLDTAANSSASTVVITGANDLKINTLTTNANDTIVATGHTGKLTISAITETSKLYAGSGDDSITAGAAGKAYTIDAGAGNDTVDLSLANTAATIKGGAGDDTLTGGTAADTIEGGTGNDTINGKEGVNTITTGTGSDTVIVEIANNVAPVTAVAQVSTITLAQTGTAGFDAADSLAVTLGGTTFTETGTAYSTLDLLGAAFAAKINANAAYNASYNAGVVTVTAAVPGTAFTIANAVFTDNTVTGTNTMTGTTVTTTPNVAAVTSTMDTVTDFTKGTDTLVITGTATAALDLTKLATPTNSAYTDLGVTLTGVTATDLSDSVQLGMSATSKTGVVSYTAYKAASGVAVTAGAKNDVIAVNGANTIKTGTGTDTIIVDSAQTTATV